MPVVLRGQRRASTYSLAGRDDEIHIDLTAAFWDQTVVRPDGTTNLDLNLATLVQDLRTAVYYIATQGFIPQ